jgi:pimeloyl-ACP methyl ester carboxylesterase
VRPFYTPSPWGWTHGVAAGPPLRRGARPLVLLHLMPFSSAWFRPLQLAMPARPTLAFDLAGSGGSSPPPGPVAFEAYARPIIAALDQLGVGRFDLLGYHTGAGVAAVMANALGARVGRLILAGIPLFDAAERAARAPTVRPRDYVSAPETVDARWRQTLAWLAGMAPERIVELFAESLRSGANGHWPVQAILNWDGAGAFSAIRQETLVPVLDESLKPNTIAAAALIARARRVDLPGFGETAFDARASDLTAIIDGFLSAPPA